MVEQTIISILDGLLTRFQRLDITLEAAQSTLSRSEQLLKAAEAGLRGAGNLNGRLEG